MDLETAHKLANLSLTAYESGITGVVENVEYLARHNCIAFQGTTDLDDWFVNLQAWSTDGHHTGFWEVGQKLFDKLKIDRPTYLTGHSQGAAVATVVACLLWERDPKLLAGLYTFGSPRVLKRGYARKYKYMPAYRFVNQNDLVCRLPSFLCGYRHVGELHYYNNYGDRYVSPNILQRAWNHLKRDRLLDSIGDHSCELYQDLIAHELRRLG